MLKSTWPRNMLDQFQRGSVEQQTALRQLVSINGSGSFHRKGIIMFRIRSSILLFTLAAGTVAPINSFAKDEPRRGDNKAPAGGNGRGAAATAPKAQPQPRIQPPPKVPVQPKLQAQPQPRVQAQPRVQSQPKIPLAAPRLESKPQTRNQPQVHQPQLQPKVQLQPKLQTPAQSRVTLPRIDATTRKPQEPNVQLMQNRNPDNKPRIQLPQNNSGKGGQGRDNPPRITIPNNPTGAGQPNGGNQPRGNQPKVNLPSNPSLGGNQPAVGAQPRQPAKVEPKVEPRLPALSGQNPSTSRPLDGRGKPNDGPRNPLPSNSIPGRDVKVLPGVDPKVVLPNNADNRGNSKLPQFNPDMRNRNTPDLTPKGLGNNRVGDGRGTVNPGGLNPGSNKPLNPSLDHRVGGTGRGVDRDHLPLKLEHPIVGTQKRTVPLQVPKNGRPVDLNSRKPDRDSKTPIVRSPEQLKDQDRFQTLLNARDHQELRRNIDIMKKSPDADRNSRLAHVNLDRISGLHQDRLDRPESFQNWRRADVGRRLDLDRQFQLQRKGDLTRQMNFSANVINAGGWRHRQHGVVAAAFTSSSFSVWYAGGGCYPSHCWYPRWSPWVNWCWWDTCTPFYDPRPYYCRPVIYQPCVPWVYYDYPVWQPMPVVACGTWVDVEPVVITSGIDLQVLAVRFVDNGHPEQNLGPRYRVWLRNNSPIQVVTPFSALVLASNDLSPSADLPQAGVVIPVMDVGEIKPVDVRLPLQANRMGLTPEGHHVPFNYLHVLVDSHQQIVEINESNNGTVVARTEILPVDPAAFSTDLTAAAPGTSLTLAGEGLGPEPGRVLISVNGQQTEALIEGWYDLGIRFTIPEMNLTGAVDADILVVRGDGAASNPLDLELSPSNMLGDVLEIPAAPYPDAPQ